MKKWTNATIRARMPWTFFSACDSTNVSPKEKQKPVSISASSCTDRITWMATLNHYWDNIPIKPIIFRVPAYSTLNTIFRILMCRKNFISASENLLETSAADTSTFSPERILPKANWENVERRIHTYFLYSTAEMGSALK